MDQNTAQLIEKFRRNPAMAQSLLQSGDGQKLMQMLTRQDGGAALNRAAQSAAMGNTKELAAMLSSLMQSPEGMAVLHRISAVQESSMSLRENIFDRQRVLSGILRSERFPNDIYPRLQLMIKDVNSLINHADFSFQRLDYIQDAALGLINIEQNEIVKIFSVAAVIFMPATLIASIYGMNFKFMPELDWTLTLGNGWNIPLGYIFAIGLMIFCSALTIWYFKYKKWL